MEQKKEVVISETSRIQQMWGWWRAKLDMAAKSPWYASYLLRRFYDLMKALTPSKQLVASTVTGAALLVGSIAMNPAPAHAAGITVDTNNGGAAAAGGGCSLSEAILLASIDNAGAFATAAGIYGCTTTGTAPGSDTITFAAGVTTINLTADLVPNNGAAGEDMVFNGPGVTINGNFAGAGGPWKTIRSTGGAAKNITVNGLTITGSSEDGVYADGGDATVTDSIISGNTYSGVRANGNVTVTNSTVDGNGGAGVYANNNATVTNSTVSGNTYSGVFASRDNVTVINSTITGNNRGVFTQNYYGGTAVMTLKNSLIVGNTGNDVDCSAASSQGNCMSIIKNFKEITFIPTRLQSFGVGTHLGGFFLIEQIKGNMS